MRLSHFFIERPVFAAVVAILITLVGAIALPNLPIAQYPDIAPPTVNVTASYPGASAETLADSVAAPIEEQINGVENMLYMSSQSTGDGHRDHHRHLQAWAPTRTRPRCWWRTGWPRRRRCCPRRCTAVRGDGAQGLHRLPDGGAQLLARRLAGSEVHRQLRGPAHPRRPAAGAGRRAISAAARRATTPCASGSTRTGRPRAT